MRVFLSVLILILGLQSWTKADDIRDFEIEGISLDESVTHIEIERIFKELNMADMVTPPCKKRKKNWPFWMVRKNALFFQVGWRPSLRL